MSGVEVGATLDNAEVSTTEGELNLYDYFDGTCWGVLFCQTGAFTPVETTELGEISRLLPEFEDRKAKVIGLCCATAEEFDAWAADALGLTGFGVRFPVITDPSGAVAAALRLIPPDVAAAAAERESEAVAAAAAAAASEAAPPPPVEAKIQVMVEAGADVNGESGSADAKGVGDDAAADEQKEMVAVAEDAGTTEGKQEGAGAGVVEQQQQPFRPALPHLVLVLDPKRQVVASLNYPAACGFASHEILRLIDAMQNSYYNEVHTPVNWVLGQDVMVAPDISTEVAVHNYPAGIRQVALPSKRDYVRLTPDPGALELPDDDGANSGIPEEEDGSGSYN